MKKRILSLLIVISLFFPMVNIMSVKALETSPPEETVSSEVLQNAGVLTEEKIRQLYSLDEDTKIIKKSVPLVLDGADVKLRGSVIVNFPGSWDIYYVKKRNLIINTVSLTAMDLLTDARVNYRTTGPMGNRSGTASNSISAGPIIWINWSIGGDIPLYPQGQRVTIYGTYRGLLGNGSFGPQSTYVEVG